MSFFEELKRRNVFKVGIAYLVGAWLLIQFSDILLNNMGAPAWVLQAIMVVLVIGLFITLFLAWAFELTPDGLKREREVDRSQSITPQTSKMLNNVILVLMTATIAYLLFDKFSSEGTAPGPEAADQVVENSTRLDAMPGVEPEPVIDKKSIAVLPFTNRSKLEEDEFFVAGIHDDLLSKLARIGSLKVISRTSMMRFKDTEKPIPEIARELGVATIMEGAVQRSGNQIRINVQLIDAETDEHLWAEIFDREMTTENLFAIQSEISQKIAEALKATLSPEEQQRVSERPTENLAAYNAFLRGRQLMARRNSEDLDQAGREFDRAVELDPDFALAWVGVADTAWLRSGYSNLSIVDSIEIREEAANRALELNDQLGEAQLSLAMVHIFYQRFDEAEAAFLKAIELSPNYATAYQWYADFVARWPQRTKESLRLARRAVELDPLSSILQYEIAAKLIDLGKFEAAERQVNQLMKFDPEFPVSFLAMSDIMGVTGKFDEQIQWMRKRLELDPGGILSYIDIVFALLDMGNEEAIADIRKTMEAIDDQHFSLGVVDMFQSMYQQNYKAALETGNWVNSQIGKQPFFQRFIGFLHIASGDYQQARAAFEIAEPRFFDRSTFRAAIEQRTTQGCVHAWIMMHTDDEDMGQELLDMTIKYLEDELPQYIDHADRFGYAGCYLARGDIEQSLRAFETQVAHGHISGWWLQTRMPWFEPLRGEPRFEAALQQIRDRVALQRENLARIDAKAGS